MGGVHIMGTSTHGGARPGAGNKAGSTRVKEKRKQYPLTILPSVIEPFKKKYGRTWSREIELMIQLNLKEQ
jgi:hypothetical protein